MFELPVCHQNCYLCLQRFEQFDFDIYPQQPRTVYKVRSTMPALSVCHPGASYNPTFNDHQALLFAACQVELFKEKEIKKLQRQLQFPSEEEMAKLVRNNLARLLHAYT